MVVLGNLFSCDVDGRSNQATADTLPLFRRATTLTVQLDADIRTNVDIAILTPGYTFTTPVWGGRLGFNLYIPVRNARTEIDQLVSGALGPIGFANQNSISDRLTSFGDPAPQLSLKWNQGVNNFMVYSRGGIPVGDYNPDRIVNLGDGCASWDNGFGYTYFNTTTGPEFAGRIRSRSGRCFYATACHDYPIRHRCDSADGARHPKQYDLVGLAMQEPQYRSPGVRELLNAVGRAKVPCMSIMNMPPLAHAGNSLRLGYGIHRTRLSASTARRASAKS